MNPVEKPDSKTKCVRNMLGRYFGHGDKMLTAECGTRAQTVVRCDVGEQNLIAQNHASFGNNFFREAGGDFHHLVRTERACFFGPGHQLIKIGFLPF